MKYYEDALNALISALNNKKTRYFCLAYFITADVTPEDIKNQLENLPSIISTIKRLDGIKDKEELLNRLENALEIRKRDYEELSRTNLVDWRNDDDNTDQNS